MFTDSEGRVYTEQEVEMALACARTMFIGALEAGRDMVALIDEGRIDAAVDFASAALSDAEREALHRQVWLQAE